jgi:uncharacterized protein YodC (DUF2158 family)
MADFAVGDVVQLKSGGHDMTVDAITEGGVTCMWSDGKHVWSQTINPALLAKSGAPSVIERRIVCGDKCVDEIVSEMRDAGTAAADGSFNITDEQARLILKRRLGPDHGADRTKPEKLQQTFQSAGAAPIAGAPTPVGYHVPRHQHAA